MKPTSIADWINSYHKKAGEPFQVFDNATLWADHRHGVVTWEIADGEFWVRHCSCDFKFWLPIISAFAREIGFKYMLTCTKRNKEAYARLSGATYVGEDEGYHKFRLEV